MIYCFYGNNLKKNLLTSFLLEDKLLEGLFHHRKVIVLCSVSVS